MANRKKPQTEALAMAPTIGANICRERIRQGLTQQQLAQKIGAHVSRISEAEHGLHETRIGRLQQIANALNVSLNQLVTPQRRKTR